VDLVFLHGPAAAGKLTTARAIEGLVGYPVFHNHLVVDLLLPLFSFGSPPFVRLREQFWLAVFAEAAVAGRSLVFTFTPEATVAAGFPQEVRRVVEGGGGRVRFVRLLVGEPEQERRITDPGRREFDKLTDVSTLRRLRHGPRGERPPADLEIDTERSSPAESAALVVDRFGLTAQPARPRYPEGP
jgi:hypothetical protein